jgi:hypothetical protein
MDWILFPVWCVIVGDRSDIWLDEEKGKDGLILFPVWGVIIGDHGEEHPHRHLVVAPVEGLSRNQPGNGRLKIWWTSKLSFSNVKKFKTLPAK